MKQLFDFSEIEKSKKTIRKTWESFRSDLSSKIFRNDDIDTALNTVFLKVFNDLFSHGHKWTIAMESKYGEINNALEQYGEQIYKREVLRGIASGLTTGTVKKPDIEDLIPVIEKWAVYTYARLLSEQIFLPITTEDRELMYAPFQCMAQYFLSKGYAGIVYSSTVFPASKNLVLFDKQAVEPYNPIKDIIVSNNF